MTDPTEQWRITAFRYSDSLSAARLRTISQEVHDQRKDVVLDYDELCLTATPSLSSRGQIREHVQGHCLPRRIRFVDVGELECSGLYAHLEDVRLDDGARSLRGTLYWSIPGKPARWRVFNGSSERAEFMLAARRYRLEERTGPVDAVDLVRDRSPAPHLPARCVTIHKRIHAPYGGDPVTVHLNGKAEPRRLFVGGLDCQGDKRPAVDAVLNLGDEASRWAAGETASASDHWTRKGEGQSGMDARDGGRSVVSGRSPARGAAGVGPLFGRLQPIGDHRLRRVDLAGKTVRRGGLGARAAASSQGQTGHPPLAGLALAGRDHTGLSRAKEHLDDNVPLKAKQCF